MCLSGTIIPAAPHFCDGTPSHADILHNAVDIVQCPSQTLRISSSSQDWSVGACKIAAIPIADMWSWALWGALGLACFKEPNLSVGGCVGLPMLHLCMSRQSSQNKLRSKAPLAPRFGSPEVPVSARNSSCASLALAEAPHGCLLSTASQSRCRFRA
ncbi:hypothetical protein L227DRAFT_146543 [Lentinus tigrinus ALCF2SS1-6]|uniref:Uncharacterized protein n=1 Tax=Lentinus tigrinus ALCF2SS1-6 TaxID=1328759 RepID=A0A5C2SRJ7_9APHY|nr:hypothetical protein L227DRAFT_146543 [Lentinus tigrinus ALCF2SS1-6]